MESKKVTNDMYLALKKPLDAKAVTKHPTKTYLSSIKAIYVTERLNDVFGCGSWQIRTEKICEGANSMIVIKATLTIPEYDIYYESFGGNDNGGETNKNFDLGDAYKGATTDAITKIGSYLGIGIDVFKGTAQNAPKTPEQPKPTTPVQNIDDALFDLAMCNTSDDLRNCWSKYKTLQNNKVFIDAKNELKLKLNII